MTHPDLAKRKTSHDSDTYIKIYISVKLGNFNLYRQFLMKII